MNSYLRKCFRAVGFLTGEKLFSFGAAPGHSPNSGIFNRILLLQVKGSYCKNFVRSSALIEVCALRVPLSARFKSHFPGGPRR